METLPSLSNVLRNHESSQLKSAILFAEMGLPVFPLHYPTAQGCSCYKGKSCDDIGKHPMTDHGFQDATTDIRTIQRWWQRDRNSNLGLLTGKDAGFIVLDVDQKHDGEGSLRQLIEEFGPLPPTVAVKSGGNGWHYYFKHPGTRVPNKVGFRPGLDIRGDGGYIVAPPSIHKSQRRYAWDETTGEIAPMPVWLLEILQQKNNRKDSSKQNIQPSFLQDGCRNNSLLSLGGFLTAKGVPLDIITKTIMAVNNQVCEPPLEEDKIQGIFASLNGYKEESWLPLQELTEVPKAPALSRGMLPGPLGIWCEDIADRLQVPLEFTAGPALVMLASLIGRRITVCPKELDDWEVIPILWGIIVSRAGSLKTPAMNSVIKLLQKLAAKANKKFLQEKSIKEEDEVVAKTEVEALRDTLKAAVRSGKKDIIAEKKQQLAGALKDYREKFVLAEKRYITNDPTIEMLLTILKDNPQGILLYRDEISGWLETMTKSGREGDREFFLEAWNGDNPYTMDRVGRGSTFMDGMCLSVLGGLQPGKLANYISSVAKGGKSDDGFMQRFQMLLYPEPRKGWEKIDRKPDRSAKLKVEEVIALLDQLPAPKRNDDGEIERIRIRYSPEAQLVADAWHKELEMRLLGMSSPLMGAHLGKYRSLMPTLALIFSATSSLDLIKKLPESIDVEFVELAIKWCVFLEAHARKSYGEHLEPDAVAGRHLLLKLKEGHIRDYDRCRDLYRRGWKGLSTGEELEMAIKVLKANNWLRTEMFTPATGGRSEVIRLNPALR